MSEEGDLGSKVRFAQTSCGKKNSNCICICMIGAYQKVTD